jgi:hypothetical protein
MGSATVVIKRVSGIDAFDLVCRTCGKSSRLHPDESVLAQVRLFLDQHRHPSF